MSLLLPGIADPFGRELIDGIDDLNPAEIADRVVLSHPEQSFPPTGGTPIREGALAVLREAVTSVAEAHGFPAKRPSATAPFDRDCAEALHASVDISPHMAASREAWTFVTCCVLPDVAAWRFPGLAPERFFGDVNRNAFRRLWWRVEILGPPRELPDPVWGREDVLVNLMERPGLTGDPSLARTICDVFRNSVGSRRESEHQVLMRDLLRRLMRRSAYTSLALLNTGEQIRLIQGLMDEALRAAGQPRRRLETLVPRLQEDAVLDQQTAADSHGSTHTVAFPEQPTEDGT